MGGSFTSVRRDFYENEAKCVKRYDSSEFWDSRYHQVRMKCVRQIFMSVLSKDLFLDVGCGTGEYLLHNPPAISKTVGIDISMNYLRRVKARNSRSHLIQADAQALPFQDKSVDLTLCSEVIEHLPRIEAAITELFRVTRKIVVVTTPNYGLLRTMLTKLSTPFVKQLDASVGHVSIMPIDQLLQELNRQKCKVKSATTFHILPPIIGQRLRIPPITASFFDALERMLNLFLPRMGNVSLIVCESSNA